MINFFNGIKNDKKNKIILNRKFLDDELLDDEEKIINLEQIFNREVRCNEIKQIVENLSPVLKDQYPLNLNIMGNKGTGKTSTILYLISSLKEECKKRKIELDFIYINGNIHKTGFNVLNTIAFNLGAVSSYYKKGYSTYFMLNKIFETIANKEGYLVLIIDEIDKITSGVDNLLINLYKTLPTKTKMKTMIITLTNKPMWDEFVDPRVKSVYKQSEIIFPPYNAIEIKNIIDLRIDKSLNKNKIDEGVIEKISAYGSREDGDCRKAILLLSKCCHIAEIKNTNVKIDYIEMAQDVLEKESTNKIVDGLTRIQKIILLVCYRKLRTNTKILTGDIYEDYFNFCSKLNEKPLTQRRFSDFINDFDLYGLINSRLISKGRYGRTREIRQSVHTDLLINIIKILEENI